MPGTSSRLAASSISGVQLSPPYDGTAGLGRCCIRNAASAISFALLGPTALIAPTSTGEAGATPTAATLLLDEAHFWQEAPSSAATQQQTTTILSEIARTICLCSWLTAWSTLKSLSSALLLLRLLLLVTFVVDIINGEEGAYDGTLGGPPGGAETSTAVTVMPTAEKDRIMASLAVDLESCSSIGPAFVPDGSVVVVVILTSDSKERSVDARRSSSRRREARASTMTPMSEVLTETPNPENKLMSTALIWSFFEVL